MSVGYQTARENEVELLTTKFYNLHIVSVEKLHHGSVCHKIEGVQLNYILRISQELHISLIILL